MEIKPAGSQPAGKGPAEYFTGIVRIDPLFQAAEPARALGVSVTFEPCARTAWHTHPLGQTLIVTAGCGLVQSWGGPIKEIRPGDVIWCPPGEKRRHQRVVCADRQDDECSVCLGDTHRFGLGSVDVTRAEEPSVDA